MPQEPAPTPSAWPSARGGGPTQASSSGVRGGTGTHLPPSPPAAPYTGNKIRNQLLVLFIKHSWIDFSAAAPICWPSGCSHKPCFVDAVLGVLGCSRSRAGPWVPAGRLLGGSFPACSFSAPINMRIWQVPDTAVALLLLLWGRTSPNKPSRKRFDTWINAQLRQMLLPYSCTTPTSYCWCWCVFPGDIVIFDTPCWLGNAVRKYLTLLFPAGNKSANYKRAVCGPARVRFFPTTAIVYAPMG